MLHKLNHNLWVGLVCLVTGCSFVYDDSPFARADAAIPIQPELLAVASVTPTVVYEGQGANENARPIPILITGENIADDATLTVSGGDLDLELPLTTSKNGRMAATTLSLPVRPDRSSEDSDAPLTFVVAQSSVSDSREVTLRWLDELSPSPGVLEVDNLAERYSRITISSPVSLVGSNPARFHATDGITISAVIDSSGRDDGQRSAGGHLGGIAQRDGDGPSGGEKGTGTAGGGGGGNLEAGKGGQGGDPGDGGGPAMAKLLVPLTAVVGHGGGGGGGGISAGEGGAGGGAIEMTAEGIIVLESTANLTVDGADGESTSDCIISGGAGGGGSAGSILLRSMTEVSIASGAEFSRRGGAGGGDGAAGNCQGGDGSQGQLRLDTPVVTGAASGFVRGPIWLPESVPAITSERSIDVELVGAAGIEYFTTINDEDPEPVSLDSASKTIEISLTPGMNRLCVLVDSTSTVAQPESLNCLSIAYISQ